MLKEINAYTRRKSSRFNIFLEAQIRYMENEKEKIIKSNIIDISQKGLKLVTKSRLHVNQEIQVEYSSLTSQEKVSLLGKVKWITYKNAHFFIGFKLDNKEDNITHMKSINCYFQGYKSPLRDLTIKNEYNNYFHYEFFCGLMFDTFSKYIEEKITHLSTDINLSKAYFDNILARIKKNETSEHDIEMLSNILSNLNNVQNDISDIVNLTQNINQEKYIKKLTTTENQSGIICISSLLEERISSFLKKIKYLSLHEKIYLTWDCGVVSPQYGYAWRINNGLDFMLLYAYMSAITGNAHSIQIHLEEVDNTMYLNIINDGTGLFLHDKQEVLLTENSNATYNLSYMENRHLAILNYILSFFSDFSSEILIKSFLGHNLLSLRLSN